MKTKNNKPLLSVFGVLFILFSLPAFSANKQILRHIEALSRDYYYVNIEDPNTPFQTQDIVGGEHENVYHILGFPGETFIIVLQSIEGEASYSLRGEGVNINRRPKGDIVTVQDGHTWIRVGISAHPDAEYKLTVKKHDS